MFLKRLEAKDVKASAALTSVDLLKYERMEHTIIAIKETHAMPYQALHEACVFPSSLGKFLAERYPPTKERPTAGPPVVAPEAFNAESMTEPLMSTMFSTFEELEHAATSGFGEEFDSDADSDFEAYIKPPPPEYYEALVRRSRGLVADDEVDEALRHMA